MRASGVSVALAPRARGKQKTVTVVAVFVVSGRQIACVFLSPPPRGILGEDLTDEFFNFFVFHADVFLQVAFAFALPDQRLSFRVGEINAKSSSPPRVGRCEWPPKTSGSQTTVCSGSGAPKESGANKARAG
jgi:hypothetical protein